MQRTIWKCTAICPYHKTECVVTVKTEGVSCPRRCIFDAAIGSGWSSEKQWVRIENKLSEAVLSETCYAPVCQIDGTMKVSASAFGAAAEKNIDEKKKAVKSKLDKVIADVASLKEFKDTVEKAFVKANGVKMKF